MSPGAEEQGPERSGEAEQDALAERRAREEADAAAREAGSIGGPAPDSPGREAERPLAEAGGGEAEGFEQAERELIEHASHGDPAPDPSARELPPEEPEGIERGEPDREHSSQREDDRER